MITDQIIFRENQWEGFDLLQLPAAEYQLLLVFAEKSLLGDPLVYTKLNEHFSGAKIVSASTAGEIIGTESIDNAVLAIAIKMEQTPFSVVHDHNENFKNSFDFGVALANSLKKD
jgi:hypothetical protein